MKVESVVWKKKVSSSNVQGFVSTVPTLYEEEEE